MLGEPPWRPRKETSWWLGCQGILTHVPVPSCCTTCSGSTVGQLGPLLHPDAAADCSSRPVQSVPLCPSLPCCPQESVSQLPRMGRFTLQLAVPSLVSPINSCLGLKPCAVVLSKHVYLSHAWASKDGAWGLSTFLPHAWPAAA